MLDALIEVIGQESVRGFPAEFHDLAAHDAGDSNALYREVHNLVSTAGNLGIKRTSALADTVQRTVRTRDLEYLDAAVEALLIGLDAAVNNLPSLMKTASNVA